MNPPFWGAVIAFIAVVVAVHLIYAGIIRPNADDALNTLGAGATQNAWVIFKDIEQQICITLFMYSVIIILWKLAIIVFREEPLFTQNFAVSNPDNLEGVLRELNELEQNGYEENSAVLTWISAIKRFKSTGNVAHASEAITASIDALAVKLESGNATLRYIVWAIPSIGFVGTVRGIGSALSQAEAAVSGDISGMVDSLGVAFNSTLVSLLISLVLMALLHLLNRRQDLMVIHTQKSCEDHLMPLLHK